MMILPGLKVVFIHIYKTGGTSLTQILAPYTTRDFRSSHPRSSGNGFQGTWHYKGNQHAKFSAKLAGFPESLKPDLSDWRFLTVVRDPYSWSLSVYREFFSSDNGAIKGTNFLFGQVYPQRRLSDFHAFVPAFMPGYNHDIGLGTQSSFVEGIPEGQLSLIRFETYEEDLRAVLPTLGIPVSDIPHALDRGPAKREHAARLQDDPRHISFCNDVYAEDFERFGYPMKTARPSQATGG
ncbi:sulfotransferase family 2 domain-containing protein [Oceanibium sediminis]|uniref:sulfotransferase family 2 domain-containing protein n=1 Tax=Oceanibium sediminis TaxID=2026339 RepID=UPI000DD461B0|nr:sulfotransferase family 2 domain-containing protein [Oceanibium sediminis]